MVTSLFGTRARRTRRRDRRSFRPSIDRLESRIALAIDTLAIGGQTAGGFIDASGDIVLVSITGSKGTAVFRDSGGGIVEDGDDIASITITGASSDFQLTVGASGIVPNATVKPLNGVGEVYLGRITADSVIRGVNTIVSDGLIPGGGPSAAAEDTVTFVLESFLGVNFSKGGGLFVDRVIGGEGGGEDVAGILLTKGFSPYSTIAIREQLDATVILGVENKAKADGRLLIESATAASIIVVNNSGDTSANSKLEILGGEGPFDAGVFFRGTFAGTVNLQSPAGGTWLFDRGVAPDAVLSAASWVGRTELVPVEFESVIVNGDFAGTLTATGMLLSDVSAAAPSGGIGLFVGGNVAGTARVNSAEDLLLFVEGNVRKGAQFNAVGAIELRSAGGFSGRAAAGDDLSAAIEGNLSGATLTSGGDLTLLVGGNVLPRTAVPVEITPRNVVNSQVVAAGGLVLFVSGNVSKSAFATGDGNITFELFTDFQSLVEFPTGILGSVKNSTFVAGGGIVGAVGGNVASSDMQARTALDLFVEGSVSGSRFATTGTAPESDLSLLVDRDFQGSIQGGVADVGLFIGGSVLKGSSLATGGDALVVVNRNFNGVLNVDELQFYAGGNVAKGSRIVARRVWQWSEPEIGGTAVVGLVNGAPIDGQNFYVGGRFDGILNVGVFDAYAGDASVTIIGGGAGSSARFYVGRFESDAIVFAGNFRGNVRVLQDLSADLTFTGSLDRITIGGRVLSDITVGGTLDYLNSNSWFQPQGQGKRNGIFVDARFNQTGSLTTGKYVTVVPVAPSVG